jgi:hypothetical protein
LFGEFLFSEIDGDSIITILRPLANAADAMQFDESEDEELYC